MASKPEIVPAHKSARGKFHPIGTEKAPVLIEFGAYYWIVATQKFSCLSAQLEREKPGSFFPNTC
jgi:hypothetical protein